MGGLFSITGVGTIVVAWGVALAVVLAVTVWWARLSRPGARAVLLRVIAQVLVTVTIALAVGTLANRYGLWFVSWRDLASLVTGPTSGDMTEHGAAATDAAGADLGGWGPADARVVPSPPPVADRHTHLQRYTVTGPASGHTGSVYVWTPDTTGTTDTTLPAVQVFHGYPVSAQSAFTNLDLAGHVSEALGDVVLLIPDWSPGELDTECVDGPAGAMETWLTIDVPAWAVATLGATPERGSWATLGYSAGGWCAAMAAMRHPQTYAAGITLGGYTRPLFSGHYRPFEPVGSAYDLPLLAATAPPQVALLAQYSSLDGYAAPTTDALLGATRDPLSVTEWHTPDAGHRVGAWKPLVPQALGWLRDTAPGFTR